MNEQMQRKRHWRNKATWELQKGDNVAKELLDNVSLMCFNSWGIMNDTQVECGSMSTIKVITITIFMGSVLQLFALNESYMCFI